MPVIKLSNQLQSLPLFQGMSSEEMSAVISQTRFEFDTADEREHIVLRNQSCSVLICVLSGSIQCEKTSFDNTYSFIQQQEAPCLIEPECFFGLKQIYSCSAMATTKCNLLKITKMEMMRLMNNHLPFRLNVINMLATKWQMADRLHWTMPPNGIEQKMAYFILTHCFLPSNSANIRITMQTLANEIHESRLNVSRTLHRLEQAHVLEMQREMIYVADIEKLCKECHLNSNIR